jgi:hypothetical protein
MASSFLYAQSEVYRKKFPEWFAKDFTIALDLVKNGEGVTKIGERDFRIPTELTEGGDLRTFNPDFGDIGRGSAGSGTVMTGSYFPLTLNFELSNLAVYATDENPNANGKKALGDSIKRAIPQFKVYLDKLFHRSSAVLATAVSHTTNGGRSVYTCDTNFGVMHLKRGQPVTVYNTGLTAALGGARVYQLDTTNRKVTLDVTIAGAGNTDKICLAGVSGASPTAIRGITYWNDYTTSGTTAGVNRANENEIISESVNASTAGLTPEMGLALYHRILQRRGMVADNLVGLVAPAQQAVIMGNLMALQTYDIGTANNRIIDRLPKGMRDKSFPFCGIPHFVDIHQDQKRIDWFRKDAFGKAELKALDFYENARDGQRFFQMYGGSGAPLAGLWFAIQWIGDFYNVDPGSGGVIYNLTLPSTGYYGS